MIGMRVRYLDYTGIVQEGVIAYMKPHRSEPDIYWFAIQNTDDPTKNDIDVIDENTGAIIMCSAYIRSDETVPI